jgi:hypothetical protein
MIYINIAAPVIFLLHRKQFSTHLKCTHSNIWCLCDIARARINAPNWESAKNIHLPFELANSNKRLMLMLLLEYFECALSRFE